MTGRTEHLVSLSAEPELADHGFQDLTVLPGTSYLVRALHAAAEAGRPAARIAGAEFLQPLILSGPATPLEWEAEPVEGGINYLFRAPSPEVAAPTTLARVKVELTAQPWRAAAVSAPRGVPVEGAQVYAQLRGNGNQYGPRFRSLKTIWHNPGHVLAQFELPAGSEAGPMPPVLLDSAVQVLGASGWEHGQTYVLQAIAAVDWVPGPAPRRGWIEGTWSSAGSDGLTGEAVIYTEAGVAAVRLQGVRLRYLGDHAQSELVVAASFTAEPIEPAVQFWAETLARPVRVTFAPYAQIFQELLKPDSQFRNNRNGLNAVLLNLGDWMTARPHADAPLEPDAKPAAAGGLARHVLPNGLKVAQLNRHETEYVYKEIFEDQVYLRHGVHLSGAQHVLDIGANIGLFSLFVRSVCPAAEVYAFEPSPVAFRALAQNCEQYGPGLHPFNVGVSERRGTAQLTFYEKSSVFSSFHPDQTEDRAAIRAVVANLVQHELKEDGGQAAGLVDELMADRLESQTFDCPLVSVSDIIRDHRLQWIDLLKIDAEKCELEILRGIAEDHWPLIGQIVIEVHDATGAAVEEVKQILTRRGFRCAVEEEQFLTGSGLFNVYATRPGAPGPSLVADLQSKADQLVSALESFTATAAAPVLLMLCPPPVRRGAESAALTLIEDDLLRRVALLPGVVAVGSRTLTSRYPGTEWFNPQTDRLGHIPYSESGFAALAESIFRAEAALRRAPYKVIAVDCDHTLWDGGVGEDGAQGVRVPPGRRALQEFLIRQMSAGMMLALCSKNAADDVWAVFSQNPGMVLKREHLAAARINWTPKSENLSSLAAELGVGIESVIFLDDNPVECAEVRAHCPSVLVVELPAEADAATARLDHVWALDHARVTAEDERRTRMVQEGAQREAFRGQTATLADFIAGLELNVELAIPRPPDYPRLAQLTQRTNQFNFTTVRRTESELQAFFASTGHRGLTVTVRDRFGDYGLVGLVLYAVVHDRYRVDTFLLSCRVLGRGVEHAVLAALARQAVADGKDWVELAAVETAKNLPARQFYAEVTGDGGGSIAASALAELKWKVERVAPNALKLGHPVAAHSRLQSLVQPPYFATAAALAAAVEAHRLRAAGFTAEAAGVAPVDLASQLLRLWRKTLGNPRIGLDDNFLDVGGTSLKAVQLVAAIRRELNRPVAVVTFFECPTVRKLAEKLEAPENAPPTDTRSAAAAVERGARRNQRLKRSREQP